MLKLLWLLVLQAGFPITLAMADATEQPGATPRLPAHQDGSIMEMEQPASSIIHGRSHIAQMAGLPLLTARAATRMAGS